MQISESRTTPPLLPERQYSITRQEFVDRFIEPWDRAYLEEHGTLDEFYTNPETGYDALLHIFCGEIRYNTEGKKFPLGFHLESTSPDADTHAIDAQGMSPKVRVNTEQREFEPYNAIVKVQGELKRNGKAVGIKGSRWNKKPVIASSMFGTAYDAFSVIKTIVDAKHRRDSTQDLEVTRQSNEGIRVKKFIAHTPLLDGVSTAPIQVVITETDEKIVHATPLLVAGEAARMGNIALKEINNLLLS